MARSSIFPGTIAAHEGTPGDAMHRGFEPAEQTASQMTKEEAPESCWSAVGEEQKEMKG